MLLTVGPQRPGHQHWRFKTFRIKQIRTLNNEPSAFYIALGKVLTESLVQRLYINVHFIRAATSAQFALVGYVEGPDEELDPETIRLIPGTIEATEIVPRGLLARS